MKVFHFKPRTVFTYVLIPVACAGVVSALLINILLTPVFTEHFTKKSAADLELASSLALEHCEENFLDLLSLRLSDDKMMQETMYRETLREITQIHSRLPSVHLLAVNKEGRVEAGTYPPIPLQSQFDLPHLQPVENTKANHRRTINGHTILFHSRYFPFWRLHIISLIPLETISAPVKMLQRGLIFSLIGISFILLITLFITMQFAIKHPLSKVIDATKEISNGTFPRIFSDRRDEIGKVTKAVNVMSLHLQENQAALEASIAEKSVLLQEIHHRVKNNLNIVVSLLHLQIDQVQNAKDPKQILHASCDRIYSMALVHEMLYQSNNFSQIDLKSYIESIGEKLFSIYAQDKVIERNFLIENVSVNLTMAMPIGLILNELITNSLLHAFPERNTGKISISIRSSDNTSWEIIYADDGIGIDYTFNFSDQRTTLGLSLISILGRQIDAEIEYENRDGYWLRMIIPMPAGPTLKLSSQEN